ncbi:MULTISPECIES: L-threonylcarbamoyladenylate synthase [Rheinheimera]|uniref:Threonylcarbamoyl-AMP synthase n=1 Tax=Rheinheimera marina TaxID=1774958 RepID=A0ABV9JQH0_9GAMM
MSKHPQLNDAVAALQQGKVIAYPTEAVFGVGCDPDNTDAIALLLQIKQRPKSKGLILIAADFAQLLPYIAADQITDEQRQLMLGSWPGPVTWVVPASSRCSDWLTGQFSTIAVRVSDHPLVQQLCLAYGKPLTSTSANLSGLEPGRSTDEVAEQLADQLAVIVDAPTGGRTAPSEIRDLASGQIFRAG